MKKLLLTLIIMMVAFSTIKAQENVKVQSHNQEKLKIRVKGTSATGNTAPDIYVDGKKFDFDLELIDPEKIESVNVIKGEKAIKEFNAPNGVVLVKTKKAGDSDTLKVVIRGTQSLNNESPMIIIDGKEVADKDILNQIAPDDIESIEIFKGEQAIEKYNAPNSVIVVTTRKAGKRKK